MKKLVYQRWYYSVVKIRMNYSVNGTGSVGYLYEKIMNPYFTFEIRIDSILNYVCLWKPNLKSWKEYKEMFLTS